ncbi:MAG: hypothetical protein HPY52_07725 [Firmicutes bacterium]|nr:hypothetical protein [Bacillota bacterium]
MVDQETILVDENALDIEELDLSDLETLGELCFTLDAGCGAVIVCGGCRIC